MKWYHRVGAWATAVYLVAIAALSFYLLCKVWPGGPDPVLPPPKPGEAGQIKIFGVGVWLSLELRQILLALFAGIVGNVITAFLSFTSYVGNRRLTVNWLPWYVLNPLVGGGVAVLFYFVYRAGLVTAGTASGVISAYGIAAIAGLSGMFSKNALDKLKEVFDVAFHAKEDAKRGDKLEPMSIATLSPPKVARGTSPTPLTIQGAGFVQNATVQVNGVDRATTFIDAHSLTITLNAAEVGSAGSLRIRVKNPDGALSSELTLAVE